MAIDYTLIKECVSTLSSIKDSKQNKILWRRT